MGKQFPSAQDLVRFTGFLRPATAGVPVGEKPVVWFSVAQTFEASALKGIIGQDGKPRTATLEEMMEIWAGLFRLGIDERRLVPWPKLIKKCRMTPQTARDLEEAGRRMGANPKQWRGAMRPVMLDDLIVEVMNEAGTWDVVKESRA